MNDATMYRKPIVSVLSPYQIMKQKCSVQDEEHPVHREIKKACCTMVLTATIEEDLPTLALFKHVPNLVAFLCTIRKENMIIGIGRGTATLSQYNRSIGRTVHTAQSASLIDAIVRGTRVLDTLSDESSFAGGKYEAGKEIYGITDKQRSYLQELISTRVADRDEREQQLSSLESLTVDEASEMIQSFKR